MARRGACRGNSLKSVLCVSYCLRNFALVSQPGRRHPFLLLPAKGLGGNRLASKGGDSLIERVGVDGQIISWFRPREENICFQENCPR